MKKAQAWSLDIMIALVLFIFAFALFFGIFLTSTDDKEEELANDASKVIEDLSNPDSSSHLIENSAVNDSELDGLLNTNYSQLKRSLQINNEFCIYLEDKDGNIISLNGSILGKGSDQINISDIPCFE